MKKIIFFIFVIIGAITLHSCTCNTYYACCDNGHPHWEGKHYKSCSDREEAINRANMDVNAHNQSVHSGGTGAKRCRD